MRRLRGILLSGSLVLALLVPFAAPARAARPHDPNVNVPLSTATGSQRKPVVVSDGAGGAIAVWEDTRSGSYHIYAQRVSADGTALWTTNGVPLCAATNSQAHPVIVPDGAGGAIVAWHNEWEPRVRRAILPIPVQARGTISAVRRGSAGLGVAAPSCLRHRGSAGADACRWAGAARPPRIPLGLS